MTDLLTDILLLIALCGVALAGRFVHRRLPDSHRTKESLDFIKNTSGLIVTLTALVLGLLLVSVSSDFRKTSSDLQTYGSMISLLDAELVDLGPPAQPLRAELRAYTAAAIASTYPEEPRPTGSYQMPPVKNADLDSDFLGGILHGLETGVRRIVPQNVEQEAAKASALSFISSVLNQRGTVIGDAQSTVPPLIFAAMVLWLLIVFFSFGLTSEQNWTTMAAIVVVALGVTSAVSITFALASPLGGRIKVSSAPMRQALRHLDHPTPPPQ